MTEWGNHIELASLCEVFNVHFELFQTVGPNLFIGKDNLRHSVPCIKLAYHRPLHYNFVREKNAPYLPAVQLLQADGFYLREPPLLMFLDPSSAEVDLDEASPVLQERWRLDLLERRDIHFIDEEGLRALDVLPDPIEAAGPRISSHQEQPALAFCHEFKTGETYRWDSLAACKAVISNHVLRENFNVCFVPKEGFSPDKIMIAYCSNYKAPSAKTTERKKNSVRPADSSALALRTAAVEPDMLQIGESSQVDSLRRDRTAQVSLRCN